MLENLTYRQKNTWLISLTVLFLLLILLLPVRNTISLYQQNTELEERLVKANNAATKINQLEKEHQALSVYFQNTKGAFSLREELLEKVSGACQKHGAIFQSLKDPAFYQESDIVIETYKVAIAGDYKTLLKVVKQLESSLEGGKIASVNFIIEQNRRTRKESLLAHIYVQRIKSIQNE